MFFGAFVMVVALGLSAVAAYYSIVGLVAIFAAAAMPIVIMGSILEVAKITVTVWLHQYWHRCQWLMKTYLTLAVIMLMFITSMGVFGFLSRAHIEQTLSAGNAGVLIADIDRQIAVHERTIADANLVIAQLDQAVQSLIDAQRIRGPNGSLAVRESQKSEREQLASTITESNAAISVLAEKKLPLVQSQQQLEAEVGPLKYIAALIYGDTVSHDLLENAVRWVIILIVAVFDPLAIVMVLAATDSFKWATAQAQPKTAPTPPAEPKPLLVEEPLGEPFQEILNKNRWNLYEMTEPVAAAPADPVVSAPEALAVVDPIEKPSYTADYVPVAVEFGNITPAPLATPPVETADSVTTEKPSLVREMVAAQRREQAAATVAPRDVHPGEIGANCQFGVKFPSNADKGMLFLRVDFLPTRLFKFTGSKWIEVNKQNTDQYAYNDAYIEMLISKISRGEYEPDWLSEAERQQIEMVLQQDPNTKGNV